MFVIQRESDGKYFRTGYYYGKCWEASIQNARVYRTKGAASNSLSQQGLRRVGENKSRLVEVKVIPTTVIEALIKTAKANGSTEAKAFAFDIQNG